MNNFDQIHPDIIEKLPKTTLAKIAEELLLDSKKVAFGGRRVLKNKVCDFCNNKRKNNCVLLRKNTRSEKVVSWNVVCDNCLENDAILKEHVTEAVWAQVLAKRNEKSDQQAKRKAATKAYFAKLYPKKTHAEKEADWNRKMSVIEGIVRMCADAPLSEVKVFGYRDDFNWTQFCWNGFCKKNDLKNPFWYLKIGKKWINLCTKCHHKFKIAVEKSANEKIPEIDEFINLLMDDY